jgi:hypothetical protein
VSVLWLELTKLQKVEVIKLEFRKKKDGIERTEDRERKEVPKRQIFEGTEETHC